MVSLGSKLDSYEQRGPGFDFQRLALSFGVLLVHAFYIVYGNEIGHYDLIVRPLSMAILPAFFALSGFLVMGSALRTDELAKFIRFRLLRIAPALSTEVLLTALLIGPLATSLAAGEYFKDPQVWSYFLNILGYIHYTLPGVFENNPVDWANGSLWTIQPEIFCYLWIAFFMLMGWYRHPKLYLAAAIVLSLISAVADFAVAESGDPTIGPLFQTRLFAYFVAGGALFHWRHRVPFSGWLALGCLILASLLLPVVGWRVLAVFPVVYLMAYLGLCRLPLPNWLGSGDYSYGVYLYAYPFQQIVYQSLPAARTWYWNVLLAAPLTFAAAWTSWHLIEKRALRLKGRVSKTGMGQIQPVKAAALAIGIGLYGSALLLVAGIPVLLGLRVWQWLVANIPIVAGMAMVASYAAARRSRN